jgi:hypothetical protein
LYAFELRNGSRSGGVPNRRAVFKMRANKGGVEFKER